MIIRTDSEHPDFVHLVSLLDDELTRRDGEGDHAYYDQFNKISNLKFVALAYDADKPVGCGSIKEHDSGAMEVKRMFVLPEYRGKGVANQILKELESWAKELSFTKCILETGQRQPEAIRFYEKCGYLRIPNYGQYVGIENSLCFEKKLE